jgi:hypothetical protein
MKTGILDSSVDKNLLKSTMNEVEILRKLDHPNIGFKNSNFNINNSALLWSLRESTTMSFHCHRICWQWNTSKYHSKNEEIKRENLQERIKKEIDYWNRKRDEIYSQSKHHSCLIFFVTNFLQERFET